MKHKTTDVVSGLRRYPFEVELEVALPRQVRELINVSGELLCDSFIDMRGRTVERVFSADDVMVNDEPFDSWVKRQRYTARARDALVMQIVKAAEKNVEDRSLAAYEERDSRGRD